MIERRDKLSQHFVRYSFDELMWDLVRELQEPDNICKPRGSEIRELVLPRLCLMKPRNRLITSNERKADYGFAVAEFLWYLRGSNKLDEIAFWNKRMPQFSDDSETLNSAYGYRLFGKGKIPGDNRYNQWANVLRTLKRDPDSRRAVMFICHSSDIHKAVHVGSKDVPCTMTLQFLIRDDELHLHVHMRSNDIHWGLTYDLFSFTLFQEIMMLQLRDELPDLKLGNYYHTAGSMHVYERHYSLNDRMLEEYFKRSLESRDDPWDQWFTKPMTALDSFDQLNGLQAFEKFLRTLDEPRFDLVDRRNRTIDWMSQQLYSKWKKIKEKDNG